MAHNNKLSVLYDEKADSLYISFGKGQPNVTSIVANNAFLDFSLEGNSPSGLEILNFSKTRGLKKVLEKLTYGKMDTKYKNGQNPQEEGDSARP